MLTRLGPPLAVLLLAGPIVFGLGGTVLPAFGYLPALGESRFTLFHFRALAAEPGLFTSALLSFATGLVTGLAGVSIVMAFIAAWAGSPAFRRVQHLVSPLLSVPHAAAAFGLAFLVAPSGMLSRLVSPTLTGWARPPDLLIVHDPLGITMMAGLVVKEVPFLLLIALAALPRIRLTESRALAASLGYGRMVGFVYGPWPLLYRQIRLAVFAVIAFGTSVVDVAAILGPTIPAPLSVRLLSWMNDPDLSMRYLASAGAVLQLGVTAAALVAWVGIERIGAALRDRAAYCGLRLRRDRLARGAALIAMLACALAVFAGLVTLALWSIAGFWAFPDTLPRSFTLRIWSGALPSASRPLATTLAVACLAAIVATIVAVLCLMNEDQTGRPARRRALFLLYSPLIVPQAAFLFGLQLLFLLTGTDAGLPALVLGHLVFVMPYVFLSLSDPWRALDRRYDVTAAGFGKRRWRRFFAIRLPMMLPAILVAAAVGFSVSVGQYLPTVLIGAGRLTTITSEAVALAAGGDRRVIGVYTFLQMILPAAAFLVATLVPALLFRRFRAMRV